MKELRLYVPKSWHQLSEKNLVAVSEMLMMIRSKYDLLVPALMIFSGLRFHELKDGEKWYKHHKTKHPFILDDDELAVMADKLEFLMEIQESNPIRWIRGNRSRHARMYNATFEEYLMAENYFFAYSQTKRVEHLENLISVIYRYPWQKWSSGNIESRSRKFRKVANCKKYAVLVWYIGFRTYVQKRCKTLFSGSGSGASNVRDYINGVIHVLNNGDITLTDRMLKQPAWYALDELEQRAKIAQEEAERIEKAKGRRQ